MLRAIFYFLLLSAFYLIFCFFLYLPVSYENKVYKEGINSEYLELPANSRSLMTPKILTLNEKINTSKYRRFTIGDFSFFLPLGDPTIIVHPFVKMVGKDINYGFSLEDYSGVELINVEYSGKRNLNLTKNLDKVFSLEISKNILLKKKPSVLYKDIFNKVIKLNETSYFDVIKKPRLLIEEPIYNFYLLKQRSFYGVDENSFFIKGKNIYGKTINNDESMASDYIEFFESGKVHAFKITYSSWRESSTKLKRIFLSSLKKVSFSENDAIENYNTFLSNPYEKRSELKNIIYLFSAWSTNFDDTRYLKAMINTMERAKKFDSLLLKNLYDFSIKRFGETFSIRDEISKKYDSSKARLKKEVEKEALRDERSDTDILEYTEESAVEPDYGEGLIDQSLDMDSSDIILD